MFCRARTRLLAALVGVLATALLAVPTGATAVEAPVPVSSPPSTAAPGESVADLVGSGCGGARARVGAASTATLRRALICLVNSQRARAGQGALRASGRLTLASRRHAADMARRGYFAHVTPSGQSPMARARAVGWRGSIGEVLASGCRMLSTPAETVAAWLASPPHRAILLGRAQVAGVGIAVHSDCGNHIYWVMNFG